MWLLRLVVVEGASCRGVPEALEEVADVDGLVGFVGCCRSRAAVDATACQPS